MNEQENLTEALPGTQHAHAQDSLHQMGAPARRELSVSAQGSSGKCGCSETADGSNANSPGKPTYVYAIGRVQARFPNLSIEKEFAQLTGRSNTAGQTDQQVLSNMLSAPENRYLARKMNWVLTIQEIDSYLVVPRDSADIDVLVQTVRPVPSSTDIDVIVGVMGPVAPPTFANGLTVPIVVCDQMYSFDRNTLLNAIPKPEETATAEFRSASEEILSRVMLVSDNAGATDEHRALNYLAMRYPAIYAKAADAFALNSSLTGVDVRPSALSSNRNMVDVVFAYTNRSSDYTEKYFVRVDVTEEFPFLVNKLSPYYER
jgi:hypothetical protein